MNMRSRAVFAAFLAFPAACASAQDARTPVLKELPPVKVHRKTNPGDLPYKDFLYIQNYVQSLLPERRRAIDVRLRVNFASDKGPDYDRFDPKSWAVAIVGDTTDHVVPVTRGGYFLLPELREAVHENATLMFNTPTREGRVALEWKLRVGERQAISYATFAQAMSEVRSVQRKIPFNRNGLREVRMVEYDGLRACFRTNEGHIEIGGHAAKTETDGACRVLKFDPATANAGPAEISFVGPLEIVTLSRGGI
ncbi:hypothetical protein [Massilia sp. LjRoot122]|uniref:hypothetical protein n=1 Tax=Massilia sp. LjRoot122 TaxID=3342257 RepID=UPI003ECEB1A5